MNRKILSSARTISLATAASRLLGFVRDLVIAQFFGTGPQAEAFVVAFRLPNLLRDLVAEGAITSAVVPVLSAYRSTKPADEFWRLAQASAVRILLASTLVGAAGVLAAPWLVRLIAPGFLHDPEKFRLTVRLTRLLFPFITLVGGWAFLCGVLNSLHHFAVPALGSAVLNLVTILGCLWLAPRLEPPVVGLAWAVLLGGTAQLLMQLPVAHALGFRWRWMWRHQGSAEMTRLLGPRLIGAAVYQMTVLLNTILASLGSLVGAGAVAALYFANRLVQLPLALFATASAQASLPALSERAAVNDLDSFRSTTLGVLRIVLAESLPAAVGLIVLAGPIVRLCFERGAFDRHSTLITAQTLAFMAIGLGAYAAGRVLAGAFYALHDTRTPVKLAAEALLINALLAGVLIRPLGVGGLALATSLSSAVNAARLLQRLGRKLGGSLWPDLIGPVCRTALAAGLMGLLCVAGRWLLGGRSSTLQGLSLIMVGGIIAYGISGYLVGVEELVRTFRWLTTRLRLLLLRLRMAPSTKRPPSGGF
ncbi:MAG: murein biosynthesis integral membrane protein MurJ [Candidatus Omnitrophica bacterium]|nr:murein biosynthesis integral membrane protein MurJ [Candidatus Omnitrophota bacterium]